MDQQPVAALYVETGGAYFDLPGVDPWDEPRDARRYDGPHPVVAHPPCQRWGRFWHGSTRKPHQYRLGADGGCFAAALTAVRNWGGVIEHPKDSQAWRYFGLTTPPSSGGWVPADAFGGWTCCVWQGHYGHFAGKGTWLYAVPSTPEQLPPLAWGASESGPTPAMVERYGYEKARRVGRMALVGGKDKTRIRNATPPPRSETCCCRLLDQHDAPHDPDPTPDQLAAAARRPRHPNHCRALAAAQQGSLMTAITTAAHIDAQTQEELMRQAGIWIEHSTLIEDDLPARPLAAVQAEKHHLDRYTQLVADRAAARGSKCLAQIEEPAQPVAEICSSSHDDAQFGERAIKPLRDISGFEYGTPLYALEAPAAPAGNEEVAFTKWFQCQQGTPYQGMWEFARAAWMARAASAGIVAAALTRLDAIYREEADCDEPPQRPDWLATALHLAAAAPQAPAAPSEDTHVFTTPYPELNDLLRETSFLVSEGANMDGAVLWLESLERVLALLAAPAAPGAAITDAQVDAYLTTQRHSVEQADRLPMGITPTNAVREACRQGLLAAIGAAPAAPVAVPWDNFPAYLIDHCEGQTITEEGLQRALSAMLANPQYAGAAPAAPAVDAALNALIADVRALPTLRASEIDGEESDGTPKHWRNRPFVSLRKLELLLRDRVTASSDTALLNFIAAEYLDLRSFGMPTGQGDADVGWRVIQHHMGEPTERVVAEVYKDDPRSAIRAAIARLERDPYCTGALHEEDAAQAKEGGEA